MMDFDNTVGDALLFSQTSTGRIVQVRTPYGRCRIELDAPADGRQCRLIAEDGTVVGRALVQFDTPEQYMREMRVTPPPGVSNATAGRSPSPPVAFTGHRGLGDTVAALIALVTLGLVTPCGRCQSRRQKLNQWVPYPWVPRQAAP
jgi:hypothetical protein